VLAPVRQGGGWAGYRRAVRDLLLTVDPTLGRRASLERSLREAIGDGRLVAGDALPSTRALADDLGISRSTVVAAYEQLAIEGYLITRQGALARVAPTRLPAEPSPGRAKPGRFVPYDFRPGSPAVGLFPRAAWLRSSRAVMRDAADEAFDYGDWRGSPVLRAQLASYLSRVRAVAADVGAVRIYGGFFAAVSFLGDALRASGERRIAIENPSLHVVRQALAGAGLEVVPVPVDAGGIVVEVLETLDVGAVLVTPSHQYPTGVAMTPERRVELIAWARNHGRWIIEDDYDGEFRYDRQPVGALQGLAPDRVIYGGTASKTLAPGLRLAWLVVPAEFRRILDETTNFRGGVSVIEQLTLADLIDRGELDRHVRAARAVYRTRREALIERLAEVVWLRQLAPTSAGLHVTVVADELDEQMLVDRAAELGIGLFGLGPHWSGTPQQSGLVLGFTRPPRHRFDEALTRLVRYLTDER